MAAKDLTGINTLKFDVYSSRTGSNLKFGIHDSGGTTSETTPNITSANTWQTVTWDISGVADANKDAIDTFIITVVNADAANTFYVDNAYYYTDDSVSPTALELTLTLGTPAVNVNNEFTTTTLTSTLSAKDVVLQSSYVADDGALTLTLYGPTVRIDSNYTDTAQALALTLEKDPTYTISSSWTMTSLRLITSVKPASIQRYIDDPIVTGGCPMCGTYLYQSKRSEPVRSRAINYGRNEDRTALKDNKYVRCGKCGFICHTQRDLESKKRAHIGWGLKYTEIEAGG